MCVCMCVCPIFQSHSRQKVLEDCSQCTTCTHIRTHTYTRTQTECRQKCDAPAMASLHFTHPESAPSQAKQRLNNTHTDTHKQSLESPELCLPLLKVTKPVAENQTLSHAWCLKHLAFYCYWHFHCFHDDFIAVALTMFGRVLYKNFILNILFVLCTTM